MEKIQRSQRSNEDIVSRSAALSQKHFESGGEKQKISSNNLSRGSTVFERPLFAAMLSYKKKFIPQEVVVPYSCLRQERFFHWPPYRSVSCSTDLTGIDHILSDKSYQMYDKSNPAEIMSNNPEQNPLRKRNTHVCM